MRSIASALDAPADDIYSQATVRAFDMLSASVFIFLFLPVWVAIAISIKLESRGHVLSRRIRVGRGGRPFFEYSFRTKYVGDDPRSMRTTRVGRFLRRTNVDVTPLFINVLVGDMSLVGSRPQPYELAADLPSIDARPGIVPPVEDDQGKLGLRTWLKSVWSAIKGVFTAF